MATRSLVTRISLFGAVVASSAVASADPMVPKMPPVGVVVPMPVKVVPPWSYTIANASENGIRESMDVAASAPLEGTPLLAGFRFRSENGDHKFRRMAVLAKGRVATLALSDSNGSDDSFGALSTWAVASEGISGSVTATVSGRVELPIPKPPAGGAYTLVLTGFELRRADNTDANVRSLGIWLDSAKSTARVTLLDDQGPDFRGFERTLGNAFIPMGEVLGPATSMGEALRMIGTRNGRFRQYAATVQYAWIPKAVVVSEDLFSGTSRQAASGKKPNAASVIEGFEFYFGNSDHNIMDVGVMPPMLRTPSSGVLRTPDEDIVEYQDLNRDDPITWSLQLATLRPPKK
jgi:hypothetical protein